MPPQRPWTKSLHESSRSKSCAKRKMIKKYYKKNSGLIKNLIDSQPSTPKCRNSIRCDFGMPEEISQEKIVESLTYSIQVDDLYVIKELRNKFNKDKKDIILFMPRPLVKSNIEQGGIIVGHKHCSLRPHTSVQRCCKCQAITHLEKHCQVEPYFVNCGEQYLPRDYVLPPKCVNCEYFNADLETHFPIDHQASDPNCEAYRGRYRL